MWRQIVCGIAAGVAVGIVAGGAAYAAANAGTSNFTSGGLGQSMAVGGAMGALGGAIGPALSSATRVGGLAGKINAVNSLNTATATSSALTKTGTDAYHSALFASQLVRSTIPISGTIVRWSARGSSFTKITVPAGVNGRTGVIEWIIEDGRRLTPPVLQ